MRYDFSYNRNTHSLFSGPPRTCGPATRFLRVYIYINIITLTYNIIIYTTVFVYIRQKTRKHFWGVGEKRRKINT